MTTTRRIDNQWIGIGLYMIALCAVVAIGMLVKATSERVPVQQALLFRFALCLIPIWIIGSMTGEKLVLHTRRLGDYLIRSIAGICSIGLFFVAISLIPLATATAIAYSAPIFCVVFSIPLLGEKIGLRRWTAVVIGFAGVLILSWPGSDVLHIGSIAGIGSAIGGALVVIYLRKMSDTESPLTTSLFYNAFGAVVFLIWCLSRGWTPVNNSDLYFMVAIGLLAGLQQFCFANAFRFAEATFLAPFEYLTLIMAAIAGYMFWGESPPIGTWVGGIIIAAAGLFMLRRKATVEQTSSATP